MVNPKDIGVESNDVYEDLDPEILAELSDGREEGEEDGHQSHMLPPNPYIELPDGTKVNSPLSYEDLVGTR